MEKGNVFISYTAIRSLETKFSSCPSSLKYKIAEIFVPLLVYIAFTDVSSITSHCMRLSISAAGTNRHKSLKKVTVSAINKSSPEIFC